MSAELIHPLTEKKDLNSSREPYLQLIKMSFFIQSVLLVGRGFCYSYEALARNIREVHAPMQLFIGTPLVA